MAGTIYCCAVTAPTALTHLRKHHRRQPPRDPFPLHSFVLRFAPTTASLPPALPPLQSHLAMVRFRIDCTLPFPREQFWLIRDSPSFFDFIVQDGLLKELKASKPEYHDDGWATRVQHYCPATVHCPSMIRAVVGDTLFEVSDEQRWNDKERPCHLHFFIKPSFLSGLSRTLGELSIEDFSEPDRKMTNLETISDDAASESENDTGSTGSATDPESSDASDSSDMEASESPEEYIGRLPVHDKSKHIVSGETRVSILTVGWFAERAIVHNLRMFYQKYPSTVARFRQKLYRDFADNDETVPIADVIERFLEKERQLECDLASECDEQDLEDAIGLDSEESLEDSEESEDLDWEESLKLLDGIRSPTRVDQDIESLMQPS